MKFLKTKFDAAFVIEPVIRKDNRGFFVESYKESQFLENGINCHFVQDNHSYSNQKGVLRGLHFQSNPCAQTKLVRVLMGEIYDVIVDLRKGSPTFGEWEGFILNDQNFRELLVPRGFAHGFVTLTDNVHVAYKVDSYYSAENNCGILWNDRKINVDWGISNPVLSEADKNWPAFDESATYFTYKNVNDR